MSKRYTVQQLARDTGVKVNTIRDWDQAGFLPPARGKGGPDNRHKLFGEDAKRTVLWLKRWRRSFGSADREVVRARVKLALWLEGFDHIRVNEQGFLTYLVERDEQIAATLDDLRGEQPVSDWAIDQVWGPMISQEPGGGRRARADAEDVLAITELLFDTRAVAEDAADRLVQRVAALTQKHLAERGFILVPADEQLMRGAFMTMRSPMNPDPQLGRQLWQLIIAFSEWRWTPPELRAKYKELRKGVYSSELDMASTMLRLMAMSAVTDREAVEQVLRMAKAQGTPWETRPSPAIRLAALELWRRALDDNPALALEITRLIATWLAPQQKEPPRWSTTGHLGPSANCGAHSA